MGLIFFFSKLIYKIIMWNIIIILTLVYCYLYKILKELPWNTFKKQEGFFLHYLIICLNNLKILKIKMQCNI